GWDGRGGRLMRTPECVSDEDLRAFLLGELPPRVCQSLSRHLETCAVCGTAVRRLDGETDPFLRSLRQVFRPAPHGEATPTPSGAETGLAPGPAPPPEPPPGQPGPRVAGYQVLGELGRGGMSVVYQARQEHPSRLVALKMILAGAHAGAERRARFLSEADAIARLQHPHIVQIFEVGEHDGLPFLSLEFVVGGSLARKLAEAPLPPAPAAALVEKLARAVDYAHQRGVVHRDLKPGNVLLTEDGEPNVTDFGIAKQDRHHLTATR